MSSSPFSDQTDDVDTATKKINNETNPDTTILLIILILFFIITFIGLALVTGVAQSIFSWFVRLEQLVSGHLYANSSIYFFGTGISVLLFICLVMVLLDSSMVHRK